ncbi:TIR-like protein FxsC [Nonomuraea soli]|uniref:FxsC-like protein n=1 Tax=Nonomuraea soli TaxID=1032476 RepID=A0A7W0CDN7_9ACTN|nr:TIR-like protein FxsC [Nonomuraea soli]MBA2889257.1 FxsC-like protein [Nonomuraea soli]
MNAIDAANDDSQAPLFFLSYAHTPRVGAEERGDPNIWVAKLFRDLCDQITLLLDEPIDGSLGFMDKSLESGQNWSQELSVALATCKVFVPLYSPRYFASESCGREWAAFTQSRHQHDNASSPILPAIWVPVNSADLPTLARNIQHAHADLGPRYAENGFYGLMKLSRYRQQYSRAVYELARGIVEVAERSDAPAGEPVDFLSVRSAFDFEDARPIVRVTVLASSLGGLPRSRDPYFYGRSSIEWSPFRDRHSSRPLGDVLEGFLASLGYQVEVRDFGERMRTGTQTAEPEVVIADPWLLAHPDHSEDVAALAEMQSSRVAILAPWNPDDEQLPAAADLPADLRVTPVSSAEDVGRTVSAVLAKLTQESGGDPGL